jgi:hypothetical protein
VRPAYNNVVRTGGAGRWGVLMKRGQEYGTESRIATVPARDGCGVPCVTNRRPGLGAAWRTYGWYKPLSIGGVGRNDGVGGTTLYEGPGVTRISSGRNNKPSFIRPQRTIGLAANYNEGIALRVASQCVPTVGGPSKGCPRPFAVKCKGTHLSSPPYPKGGSRMEGFGSKRSHHDGPDSDASLLVPACPFLQPVNAGRPSRVQITGASISSARDEPTRTPGIVKTIERNHRICSTSARDVAFLTQGGW